MSIIVRYIRYQLKRIARQFYWLYRLSKVHFGEGAQLEFPLQIEGKGKISAGKNVKLNRRINLGCGNKAILKFGNNNHLEAEATILIGQNNSLHIGDNFVLGTSARLYIQNNWEFQNDVSIHSYCSIFSRENGLNGRLIMKNNSHIGDYCIFDVSSDISIGENVAIGPNCTFYTHDHSYENLQKAAWDGDVFRAGIDVGSDSWIGSNVTVLPGVTIGKHVVVAAGSIVTKDLDDFCVYAGVPAKKIKEIK